MRNQYTHVILILGLLILQAAHAGTPLWTFKPLTSTNVSVSPGEILLVQYIVTNQSNKSHTLLYKTVNGITQTTSGAGVCGVPFNLSYQESCILNLQIDGNNIFSSMVGGPVICEQGNPLQCYQPSGTAQIKISYSP